MPNKLPDKNTNLLTNAQKEVDLRLYCDDLQDCLPVRNLEILSESSNCVVKTDSIYDKGSCNANLKVINKDQFKNTRPLEYVTRNNPQKGESSDFFGTETLSANSQLNGSHANHKVNCLGTDENNDSYLMKMPFNKEKPERIVNMSDEPLNQVLSNDFGNSKVYNSKFNKKSNRSQFSKPEDGHSENLFDKNTKGGNEFKHKRTVPIKSRKNFDRGIRDDFEKERFSKNWEAKGVLNPNNKELEDLPDFRLLLELQGFSLHVGKDKRFPQEYRFICNFCNYWSCDYDKLMNHLVHQRHEEKKRRFLERVTFDECPSQSGNTLREINIFLEKTYQDITLDSDKITARKNIVHSITSLLSDQFKDCGLEIYGSVIHGFGNQFSNMNLLFTAGPETNSNDALEFLFDALKLSERYRSFDVTRNGSNKITKLTFINNEPLVRIEIIPVSMASTQLSKLISKYSMIDERANMLITLFRYWAAICLLDKPVAGTFSGFALYVMAIHFLQQCSPPVLPVLHLDLPKYFENNKMDELEPSEVKTLLDWSTDNTQSLAELWINLLQFYVSYDFPSNTIAIDQKKVVKREERGITAGHFGISNPLIPFRNLSKVTNNKLRAYIEHCIYTTWKYFSIPQTKKGPIIGGMCPYPPDFRRNEDPYYIKYCQVYLSSMSKLTAIVSAMESLLYENDKNELKIRYAADPSAYRLDIEQLLHDINLDRRHAFFDFFFINCRIALRVIPTKPGEEINDSQYFLYKDFTVFKDQAEYLFNVVRSDNLDYKFSMAAFTDGEVMPLECRRCGGEGHVTVDCPYDKLEPFPELPPINEHSKYLLNRLCFCIYESKKQTAREVEQKREVVEQIQEFLNEACGGDCSLTLFGSSVNGFGFVGSDLDLCVKFANNDATCDKGEMIKNLHDILTKFEELDNLMAITTAKVPIVKFVHKSSSLEGDISLYNELPIKNTQLLKTYSEIDERVKILGFMLKLFAQYNDISQASKGSLSSYAYILMVIFYLQRVQPPIVPVLQELNDGSGDLEFLGRLYFFKDLSKLETVWKNLGKNQMTPAELWLDMLRFYTEEFDLKCNVIAIHTSDLVSKDSKRWTTSNISIEDPFDSTHNLGFAMSMSMNIYVIKQLRGARIHFSQNVDPVLYPAHMDDSHLEAAYFDSYVADGSPPNDRRCLICKSIGHMARDCPEKLKNPDAKPSKVNEQKNKDLKRRNNHALKEFNNNSRPNSSNRNFFAMENKQPIDTGHLNFLQNRAVNVRPELPQNINPMRFPVPIRGSFLAKGFLSRFPNHSTVPSMVPPFNFHINPPKVPQTVPDQRFGSINQNGPMMLSGVPLIQFPNYGQPGRRPQIIPVRSQIPQFFNQTVQPMPFSHSHNGVPRLNQNVGNAGRIPVHPFAGAYSNSNNNSVGQMHPNNKIEPHLHPFDQEKE